jgi:Toprim-like
VRAYCHIHGSDHQRSLSINRRTGWGHCFNATCEAVVLVAEWNPRLAQRLHFLNEQEVFMDVHSSGPTRQPSLSVIQPVLLLPSATPPQWQQEERQALLSLDGAMRKALVQSRRVGTYLHERGIPLEVAQACGVGYLPAPLLQLLRQREQRALLYRWTDRLLFPLHSPDGQGYIGRSLWQWVPGMDEHRHKALLELSEAPRRWIKTNPAGWFAYNFDQHPRSIILVEGAFDRLALLTAGMQPASVVALAGTAVRPDWIPAHVTTILLALDADAGGEQATERLTEQLEQVGLSVSTCSPPQDSWGIDWSERWRKMGRVSVRPLLEAWSWLASDMATRHKRA